MKDILNWTNLRREVEKRNSFREAIPGNPPIELVYNGETNSLLLHIHSGPIDVGPKNQFQNFDISKTDKGIQLLSHTPHLHKEFYTFCLVVIAKIHDQEKSPILAVREAVSEYSELIKENKPLSIEREAGLFGELVFLYFLLKKTGIEKIYSWIGPQGEIHDFRFDKVDFEIKTTIGSKREHWINGFKQTIPDKHYSLFVVSIILASAGLSEDGKTLPELIDAILMVINGDPNLLASFRGNLSEVGYDENDSELYKNKFKVSEEIVLIPVDENFPHIKPEEINLMGRLIELKYRINLEGMGFPLESAEGEKVLCMK